MTDALLQRPVKSTLINMVAPAAFGMLMTFLFQLVDTYFVGKLGTKELAAISFSYPVYFLVISFFMGAAAGVSSAVGKALGEKNTGKAKSLSTLSILLFMFITVGLGLAGFNAIPPVFRLLGAGEETLPLIADYMKPLYLGMFLLVGGLIANSSLMAKGKMMQTTAIMAVGGLINLVLDYLLIFGMGPIPAMALKGAAYATVISWCVIFILMTVLAVKEDLFSFRAIPSYQKSVRSITHVFHIALPAITAQILNPIAIAIITRFVSQSGENAVAAYGIATRIESLGLTGILALSVILTPLVAQNFGAKQQTRLDQVIAYSGRMTVYWGFVLYALMLLFATTISSLFTDNPEVIQHSRDYFYWVGLSFPAFGLVLITTSIFNGVQQPLAALKLTLLKTIGLTIPLAIIGSLFSIKGIWIGLAMANIVGAVYAKTLLTAWLKQNNSDLQNKNPLTDYKSDAKYLIKRLFNK